MSDKNMDLDGGEEEEQEKVIVDPHNSIKNWLCKKNSLLILCSNKMCSAQC